MDCLVALLLAMANVMRIFTIGYEGATVDEFLTALKAAGSSG